MINKSDRILITGGTGLIGKNLTRELKSQGYEILATGSEVDLRESYKVNNLFLDYKPTVVYHLAAKVGGIFANVNYKSQFYSDNVLINTHVVNACKLSNVRYVFAMGTGCAYPKRLESEILNESDYLDGIPESTNDAYAYAKRGLLVHLKALAESMDLKYIFCLPANIYGPYDNFHPRHSHVIPGLIRRFCDSKLRNEKSISIWGNGTAKRDFLFIDDCIEAVLALSKSNCNGVFNVGTSELTSIKDLSYLIKSATGFNGDVEFDVNMPSGQMQRIFDCSGVRALGWKPKVTLSDGIEKTVNWFVENRDVIREY